jgi:hypothetical protein
VGAFFIAESSTPLEEFALSNKNGKEGFLNFMNGHRQKFTGWVQKALSPKSDLNREVGKIADEEDRWKPN